MGRGLGLSDERGWRQRLAGEQDDSHQQHAGAEDAEHAWCAGGGGAICVLFVDRPGEARLRSGGVGQAPGYVGSTEAIRYVCRDMWKAYLRIIARKLWAAMHILYRYHIVVPEHLDISL